MRERKRRVQEQQQDWGGKKKKTKPAQPLALTFYIPQLDRVLQGTYPGYLWAPWASATLAEVDRNTREKKEE